MRQNLANGVVEMNTTRIKGYKQDRNYDCNGDFMWPRPCFFVHLLRRFPCLPTWLSPEFLLRPLHFPSCFPLLSKHNDPVAHTQHQTHTCLVLLVCLPQRYQRICDSSESDALCLAFFRGTRYHRTVNLSLCRCILPGHGDGPDTTPLRKCPHWDRCRYPTPRASRLSRIPRIWSRRDTRRRLRHFSGRLGSYR